MNNRNKNKNKNKNKMFKRVERDIGCELPKSIKYSCMHETQVATLVYAINKRICSDKLVLPQRFANRIFRAGFTTLISVFLALYCNRLDNVVITLGVFINSCNYWRHPTDGFRRKFDMIWALFGCLYQVAQSKDLGGYYLLSYWIAISLSISSYAAARYYGRVRMDLDTSSFMHTGIHYFGNMANTVLYVGLLFYRRKNKE
jgi:hypothetical protein